MPRLLCYVLEHLGFPEEPRLEMRVRCPLVMSVERVMTMPVSFHIRPQDQEEVPGQDAEDHHADDMPTPEPEVQRTPIPDRSPPSPPHTTSAAADTPGPSSCSWLARGAHHRGSFFGCSGCSSSSFRPTTTTAVRWLGFFLIFFV